MVEYRCLEIAVFEDGRFTGLSYGSRGLITRLESYIGGVFAAGRLYNALDHAPEQVQSFNNPKRYYSVKDLEEQHPELANQVESYANKDCKGITEIAVYRAMLLDDTILGALERIPHLVTQQDSENAPIGDPQEPVLVTLGRS